jgi:hypothetical protein
MGGGILGAWGGVKFQLVAIEEAQLSIWIPTIIIKNPIMISCEGEAWTTLKVNSLILHANHTSKHTLYNQDGKLQKCVNKM